MICEALYIFVRYDIVCHLHLEGQFHIVVNLWLLTPAAVCSRLCHLVISLNLTVYEVWRFCVVSFTSVLLLSG